MLLFLLSVEYLPLIQNYSSLFRKRLKGDTILLVILPANFNLLEIFDIVSKEIRRNELFIVGQKL